MSKTASVIDSITHHLSDSLRYFSDIGNAAASKVTTWFGLASVGTGATLGVTNDTMEKVASGAEWGLPDYAALISIIGGLAFFIKVCVDIYYKIKSDGKL